MANAHELARGHKRLRALIEFASARLARQAHAGRAPHHQGRLRGDLHQFDRERPPGQLNARAGRSAAPSERPAWSGRRSGEGAAMAEMTSQDMAGKCSRPARAQRPSGHGLERPDRGHAHGRDAGPAAALRPRPAQKRNPPTRKSRRPSASAA